MSPALSPSSTHDRRVQAVLAMPHGDSAAQVCARYGIGRSALYKFRRRALAAISDVLRDHPRGPKRPHNHVSADWEQKTLSLCELYPTLSSYRIAERLGRKAPRPRTIQRIRKRHHLKRFPKRQRPLNPGRKLTSRADREVRNPLHEKSYLGPDRLAWDLLNSKGIRVSRSTFKRRKKKWGELVKFFAPPAPAWRFTNATILTAFGTGIFWRRSRFPTSAKQPISWRSWMTTRAVTCSAICFSTWIYAPRPRDHRRHTQVAGDSKGDHL